MLRLKESLMFPLKFQSSSLISSRSVSQFKILLRKSLKFLRSLKELLKLSERFQKSRSLKKLFKFLLKSKELSKLKEL